MAARSESARRVSDCVTALLRDQPFFGSLALSVRPGTLFGWAVCLLAADPRPDETRETLAQPSDLTDDEWALVGPLIPPGKRGGGKHSLRAPWVADTDADRIKTALARVVLACALKHHTRRGGRDPERWQRLSRPRSWSPTDFCATLASSCRPRPKPGMASAPSRPTTGFRNRSIGRRGASRIAPRRPGTETAIGRTDSVRPATQRRW